MDVEHVHEEEEGTRGIACVEPALQLLHQIDLFYVEETEIAKYVTIIECKYRKTEKVEQEDVQKLAYVKNSVRAHKAIMVASSEFTSGAHAVAKNEEIALLLIKPQVDLAPTPTGATVDQLFDQARMALQSASGTAQYSMTVVHRLHSDPNESSRDLVAALLADPKVREVAEKAFEDPEVRRTAQRLIDENPGIAREASRLIGKFFG